jgi:hypothetical protein
MSRITLRSPVIEEFLAFSAEKTADDGNGVIALLEHKPAGNETSPPLGSLHCRITLANRAAQFAAGL